MAQILNKSGYAKVIIVFVLLFCYCNVVNAMGVTPSIVGINDLSRDVSYELELLVISRASKGDQYYSFTPEGDGSKYIVLPKNFYIPSGMKKAKFKFTIYPVGAPNGSYFAKIRFSPIDTNDGLETTSSVNNKGNTVAVIVGAVAEIRFTVTDKQIKSCIINSVQVSAGEQNTPPFVYVNLQNTGNVDAILDKVVIEFIDVTDATNVISTTINGDVFGNAKPKLTNKLVAQINKKINVGKYYTTAQVWFDSKLIYTSPSLIVDIYPDGTLKQSIDVVSYELNGDKFKIGDLIKFTSQIKNTGAVGVTPIFYVEIKKDGVSVDLLRSENKIIGVGLLSQYILAYKPQANGSYSSEGYFEFGAQKSDSVVKLFNVEGGLQANSRNLMLSVGGIIAILVLLVGLLFLFKRKPWKRKDNLNNNERG